MTKPSVRAFSGLDFDFAVGQLYGLRVWKMDERGRLRAKHVSHAPAWRPGLNMATCERDDYALGGWLAPASLRAFFDPPKKEPAEPAPAKERRHQVPVEDCGCGFYAYTGTDRPEISDRKSEDVVGVIRGTGRTLIGTHGFRCEKAEIVALLDPTLGGLRLGKRRRQQRRSLRRLYPDVPLMVTIRELERAFPIEQASPDPSSDEFWSLP